MEHLGHTCEVLLFKRQSGMILEEVHGFGIKDLISRHALDPFKIVLQKSQPRLLFHILDYST